jgi:hypothetical protein
MRFSEPHRFGTPWMYSGREAVRISGNVVVLIPPPIVAEKRGKSQGR